MTASIAHEARIRTLDKTRVLVFALKAGGTAKTSSCTSLAAILGARGYKVLVIDLDPQCNSSQILGYRRFRDGQPGIIQVMKQEASLQEAVVQARYQADEIDPEDPDDAYDPIENVYIVPANSNDPDVDEAERLLNDPKCADSYWLREGLADMDGQWDAVLIDCPATYGRATVTAFVALDKNVDGEVIPPILCTLKEGDALVRLEKKLQEIRDLRKYAVKGIQPEMKRVLVCCAPNSSFGRAEHWKTLGELQETYGDVLLPLIHWSGVIPSIYRDECPVPILAPNSMPAQEYNKVATALGFTQIS
ncbi:ParA family protein [Streptomyces sp. B-S-A8]|uniref:ParA family protein n=1 Tax=Streptomyces solicavernae TaxID=3043614 RepID=A0ABT6S0C5_9ACTN|nr:ParA family protein [Streptomyces sp. B-S-A8]MDI3390151.1 ParA family protein [Streptomyces sp. B-S-A8]